MILGHQHIRYFDLALLDLLFVELDEVGFADWLGGEGDAVVDEFVREQQGEGAGVEDYW
jgi:hypothetical protein